MHACDHCANAYVYGYSNGNLFRFRMADQEKYYAQYKTNSYLKKYSVILLLALLAKFISFIIMYINVIYIKIISVSLVFVVAQDICEAIFEIFAIAAWMQRYNLFFSQRISFLLILIWCVIELTQSVPWEIIFSINTIIGYLGPYCFASRKDVNQ